MVKTTVPVRGTMTIVDALESAMMAHPHRLAVVAGEERLTYSELDEQSRQIAGALADRGIGRGAIVALLTDRSVRTIAGLCGIVRAGACYLPLELGGGTLFTQQLQALAPALTLTPGRQETPWAGTLLSVGDCVRRGGADQPLLRPSPEDALYTMFTSGSSGPAKAVLIRHTNLEHYLDGLRRQLPLAGPLNYACISSLRADLGNTAIYGALCSGGCLHLLDDATRHDAELFRRYLIDRAVDVLKITPSHLRSLVGSTPMSPSRRLKVLIFGGERLSRAQATAVQRARLADIVVNHYGPTETTVGAALYVVPTNDDLPPAAIDVPIGWPIGDASLELVGEGGTPVRGSGTGELFIGGPAVGGGYLNDEALTAERFVECELNYQGRQTFYRTGDLCRRHANGALEFLRRCDRQVKVRGYRVDPESLEVALRALEAVDAAAVVPVQRVHGLSLAAAVVWRSGQKTDLGQVRQSLLAKLPAHMVPSHFVTLDELPLNENGKIDLAAVEREVRELLEGSGTPLSVPTSKLTELEEQVAVLWREYLGRQEIGPDDRFEDVGGDSLAAIQIVGELRRRGYHIAVHLLLEPKTVRQLAQVLAAESADGTNDTANYLAPAKLHAERSLVLGPMQQWFFCQGLRNPDHWNQAVLVESKEVVDRDQASRAIDVLGTRHPLLRTCYINQEGAWTPRVLEWRRDQLTTSKLPSHNQAEHALTISETALAMHREISIVRGPVVRWHLFEDDVSGRGKLLAVAHHLAVDGVSWRVLVEEFVRLYGSSLDISLDAAQADLGAYWSWAEALRSEIERPCYRYAAEAPAGIAKLILPGVKSSEGEAVATWIECDERLTVALQRGAARAQVSIDEMLLAGLALALSPYLSQGTLPILLEGHGRRLGAPDCDVTRTVGWFTTMSTVLLPRSRDVPMQAMLEVVRLAKRSRLVPAEGGGDDSAAAVEREAFPEICLNYLGRFSIPSAGGGQWAFGRDYVGPTRGPANRRLHRIVLTGRILHDRLVLDLAVGTRDFSRDGMATLASRLMRELRVLCQNSSDLESALEGEHTTWIDTRPSAGLLTYWPYHKSKARVPSSRKETDAILVTGATGFLGIYLLRELLATTTADVHVLVRSSTPHEAGLRLSEEWCWHFGQRYDDATARRIRVVCGDLTRHNLGITTDMYAALARTVDMVVHAAADVRLLASRRDLTSVNVDGTRRIVEFCATGHSKELHYISTLSVAGQAPGVGVRSFTESDREYGQSFLNAYEESKLRGEALAMEYAATGPSVYVYRTGSIVTASDTGRFQRNASTNRLLSTLRGYVALGCAPTAADERLYIAHVDHVARDIIAIAFARDVGGGTFHVGGAEPIDHDQLVSGLQSLGHNVRKVTREEFKRAALVGGSARSAWASLAALWAERPSRNVRVSTHATERLLRSLQVPSIRRTDNWLSMLLAAEGSGAMGQDDIDKMVQHDK